MKKDNIVKALPAILFGILLLLEMFGVIKFVLVIGFFVSILAAVLQHYATKLNIKEKIHNLFKR